MCPLTELENHLRGQTGYADGFIAQYLDGVLYPDEYLVLSRVLAAALVLVAYTGALVRWRRTTAHGRAAPVRQ